MTDRSVTPSIGPSAVSVAREARLAEWTRLQAEIARLEARANDVLSGALDDTLTEAEQSSGLSREREIPLRPMAAEYAAAARMSETTLEGLAFDARPRIRLRVGPCS